MKLRVLVLSLVFFMLSACAFSKMPLSIDAKSIDTESTGILIGRVRVENKNKPSYQPVLQLVIMSKDGKAYGFNQPTTVVEGEYGNDYLFSMAAAPGPAELAGMSFNAKKLLINANARLRFNQAVEYPSNGVTYIGNINATIVGRKDDEPRAGPLTPLFDQSIAGFSSGTFKVDITDNFEEDTQLFLEKFPALKGRTIGKAILQPWVHPVE